MLTVAFDPARDGFGFRNPRGEVPSRLFGGEVLRPFDSFLYGSGLCFGMAVAALMWHEAGATVPVSGLRPTPELLMVLRRLHARQLWPRVVCAAAHDWLAAGGGRPDSLVERLRLPGETDPHVLNFGPSVNGRFFRCLYGAHAVVPYRVEHAGQEVRLYVYDPNHPGDRGRFVRLYDGEFGYSGFRSEGGWGITLLPLSAVMGQPASSAR